MACWSLITSLLSKELFLYTGIDIDAFTSIQGLKLKYCSFSVFQDKKYKYLYLIFNFKMPH